MYGMERETLGDWIRSRRYRESGDEQSLIEAG
jgi:hypothetical protein